MCKEPFNMGRNGFGPVLMSGEFSKLCLPQGCLEGCPVCWRRLPFLTFFADHDLMMPDRTMGFSFGKEQVACLFVVTSVNRTWLKWYSQYPVEPETFCTAEIASSHDYRIQFHRFTFALRDASLHIRSTLSATNKGKYLIQLTAVV